MPTAVDRLMGRKRLTRRLDGERFGRLVVLRYAGQHRVEATTVYAKRWRNLWLCRCDCGSEVTIREHQLLGGRTRSCGCLRREVLSSRGRDRAISKTGRWERWRQDRRLALRVLWLEYWEMFCELRRSHAVPDELIESRWVGDRLRLRQGILNERAPLVPMADEALVLAQILGLRGMEKERYLAAARAAREAIAAWEAGEEWAVKRVSDATGLAEGACSDIVA